eukprot:CAMPEP_0177762580 /NCGR_PEP_ID=MMETSP0491_2-20121128/6420_1 /TAXON_ID=63592 /ORGANISM="Tetraselmis chuii, Strain PLY429" /LENGTH=179 /DNA_ID=CAMNT_0019278643 /DNA_START=96 /DNA_END=637 /DNA_ORIENTATION=+
MMSGKGKKITWQTRGDPPCPPSVERTRSPLPPVRQSPAASPVSVYRSHRQLADPWQIGDGQWAPHPPGEILPPLKFLRDTVGGLKVVLRVALGVRLDKHRQRDFLQVAAPPVRELFDGRYALPPAHRAREVAARAPRSSLSIRVACPTSKLAATPSVSNVILAMFCALVPPGPSFTAFV